MFRILASAASIGLTVAMTAGCGQHNPLGPPVPKGATMINGPASADPPPPPGWKQNPVIPTSQQQAQDTIVGYLKKTLAALPAGTTVDASRYGGGITTVGCNDNDNSPTAPQEFSTWGDLNLPPGTDIASAIAQVGDIWKSWGWYVIERDGFRKPNRFAYGPDDYRLQIEAAYPEGYPPTLSGVSPCFPGDVPKERTSFPTVLRAD
ncbi:MAG: hypothetical protein E6R06_23020 [Mycobacterium sp.]|nr:MAG: hypothetical protein E6R06_23020 [Mycobacterium sp.]